MSVLTLSPEVFYFIQQHIERAAYNKVVDQFYYQPIQSHFRDKEVYDESYRLIRSWADLNYKSYAFKYKEPFVSIAPLIKYSNIEYNAFQLLKFVDCLYYNIEPEHWELTDQEQTDLHLLKRTKNAIAYAIIDSLSEYKAAKWAV